MKRLNLTFKALLTSALFFVTNYLSAQGSGTAGIQAAQSEIQTYVDPVGNLILVIGAIVGLAGAIRCYIKWNTGDQDVQKSLMGWMGACVFLVVAGIVIKAFFGV